MKEVVGESIDLWRRGHRGGNRLLPEPPGGTSHRHRADRGSLRRFGQVGGLSRTRLVRRDGSRGPRASQLRAARTPAERSVSIGATAASTHLAVSSDRGSTTGLETVRRELGLSGVTISRRLGSPELTAQVHPARFTRALMRAAELGGAELRIGHVVGVLRDRSGDFVVGVVHGGVMQVGGIL